MCATRVTWHCAIMCNNVEHKYLCFRIFYYEIARENNRGTNTNIKNVFGTRSIHKSVVGGAQYLSFYSKRNVFGKHFEAWRHNVHNESNIFLKRFVLCFLISKTYSVSGKSVITVSLMVANIYKLAISYRNFVTEFRVYTNRHGPYLF